MLAGTHADVQTVVPEGLSIGVDWARELIRIAGRAPSQGRWQIVLVEDADRMESESLEFHRRVRQTFRALAEADPDRYLVLDATRPVDELAGAIRLRVAELLSGLELQTLRSPSSHGPDGHRRADDDGAPSHPHAQTGPTPQLHP